MSGPPIAGRPPVTGGPPLWLRAVHKLERAVGEPLESVLHSDAYFDVVSELLRARRVSGRALEGVSRRLLHLANLPAGSDIRRVREQLSRVERRLAQLASELEQSADHAGMPDGRTATEDDDQQRVLARGAPPRWPPA